MRKIHATLLICIVFILAAAVGSGAQQQPDEQNLVLAGVAQPSQIAALYANSKNITTTWEKVWRPMCGTPAGLMTPQNLLHNAAIHELEIQQAESVQAATGGGQLGSNITITFTQAASVPAAASAALVDVKAYLQGLFSDPITVNINVSFQSLDPGVLGQTGSNYTSATWSTSRNGLINGMDSNDDLQTWLPTTSTIPVRYNGNSSTITNETRVFWTLANFRATVGSVSGAAADMIFNSNFAWDYNPSNGVIGYSFQDVVAHEVGHALGFSSGIDGRINDMEALDIFRFQRSDGSADYNPDSKSEFQKRPRLVSFNSPTGGHICDLTAGLEYRMCDGMPNQASHFMNKEPPIGLMDPSLGPGISFYPNFFGPADLNMFDAIGYDR